MTGSVASGLEGVVVADTALSEVDGERGRLVIAGHDVEALGGKRSFEELCRELESHGFEVQETILDFRRQVPEGRPKMAAFRCRAR